MTKHLIIPDVQIRPGDNLDFLERIGRYVVEKKPDTIVCIGDFADMASLSSYDIGRKSFEGRRYRLDIDAAREAMARLLSPIDAYNDAARRNGKKQYKPQKVLTLGNHENRIDRAVDSDPKLDGTLGIGDLGYEEFGWEVYPFLEVVVIDGVAYSHYFTSGVLGRPCTTAAAILNKKHMSCIAGHQQGRQVAYGYTADGRRICSIIAGSAYEREEEYMGPQGNRHWRGIVVLHEVQEGGFDEMFVSLEYIKNKYGTM